MRRKLELIGVNLASATGAADIVLGVFWHEPLLSAGGAACAVAAIAYAVMKLA